MRYVKKMFIRILVNWMPSLKDAKGFHFKYSFVLRELEE